MTSNQVHQYSAVSIQERIKNKGCFMINKQTKVTALIWSDLLSCEKSGREKKGKEGICIDISHIIKLVTLYRCSIQDQYQY